MPDTSTLSRDDSSPRGRAPAPPARSTPPPATAQLVAAYPGPALVADRSGRVLQANAAAGPLQAAIEEGTVPDVTLALGRTAATGEARTLTATLPAHLGGLNLKLALVAGGDADRWVLALGSDASLDLSLRNALVESRQRYKDLVACSTDFAWETGSDGRFVFVSPRGVLGYHPDELVGRPARDFVCDAFEVPEQLPFECDRRVKDAVLWFRLAGGGNACLKVSSVPLFAPDATWSGARGVARDITTSRAKDLLIEAAHRREQVLDAIARAMRTEIEPEAMLDAAARAIVAALGLSACWVLRIDGDGRPYVAASRPNGWPAPAALLARLGDIAQGAGEAPGAIEADGALLVPTLHAHAVNGALAGLRAPSPWTAGDRELLNAVATQIGIVIEQASILDQLHALSRTDALTGLLNRRAFVDEAGRRLSHAVRMGRPAAVLYIDLNNFKVINDAFGHRAGDEVLRIVTAIVAETGRGGDVAARFGGDEFVVWLDETDAHGAAARAEALVATVAARADIPRAPASPFGFAIGVAAFDPESGEDLASLLERADHAMYEAKRAQATSSFHLAPACGAAAAE